VIEDEYLVRMAVDEFDRLRQVPLENENVVRQPEIAERVDAAIEVVA
jgi:hypothetical protein